MTKPGSIEIKDGIYWVGGAQQDENLHCNPYLLIEGEEGVLFDPGSVLDFEYVYENVTNLIPLEKLKYIVLHHQDPDICASLPLFEAKGGNFKIVTHWRTQTLVKYYGIRSDYYIVNEHDFKLTLVTGRVLDFIQTPYLHFPGAIATYDATSKVLFSSDLFGAISKEWTLFAPADYIEKMKAFHEHYMPSNDILRPVMEVFLAMDIAMIAPQHGSVINSDVKKYIRVLRDLECGVFLTPIRRQLAKSGGYLMLASMILHRFIALFGIEEVRDIVDRLDIEIDEETYEITDYNYTGDGLWNNLFKEVVFAKGIKWLIVIEPLVQKLAREYEVPMPDVFLSVMKESYEISEKNLELQEWNQKLEQDIRQTKERLIKCPVTGLYNFDFFKDYFTTQLTSAKPENKSALIIINIDDIAKIRFTYGNQEVDEVLKNTVYLLDDVKNGDNSLLFRLHGAALAWYLPDGTKTDVLQKAEAIRNLVATSTSYIQPVTLSLGVVFFEEIQNLDSYAKHPFEVAFELAKLRAKLAGAKGKNLVCSVSEVADYKESLGKILIVDTDEINLDVLRTILENLKYEVITAKDGEAALACAERDQPDAIISEVMLPKKDAFMVRERLLQQSQTKKIQFILVSHLKNEDSLKRSLSLGIEHYLKKPFMLSELVGIVKLKVKGEYSQ